MPDLRRSSLPLRDQLTEVHVFAVLGALRIAMLWFAGALDSVGRGLGFQGSQSMANLGTALRAPMILLYLLILVLLYGQLLRGRSIPALLLDGTGVLMVIALFVHFIKINLLMLTGSSHPQLLLGQVITYLLFFVVAWGWIFWRLDRVAGPLEQQIVEVPQASSSRGSFDYYYASMMSLLGGKMSGFQGLSRLGKLMAALHSFMILDLAAIALARFYQLVQKSL